jgi:hypothetical protein
MIESSVPVMLVSALVTTHLCWLFFWLCGSVLGRRRSATGDEALLELIVATIAGVAITGLVTFALGIAHLLYPAAAFACVVLLGVVLALRGDSPLRAAFWRERLTELRLAASPGVLLVWMASLLLAVPAIVPDGGSDATAVYLPQALEWARDHYLSVNLHYRLPWYPAMWSLILSWTFSLGAPRLGQFFGWLCALLSMLATYGIIVWGGRRLPGVAGLRGLRAIAVLSALAVGFTPAFVQFLDSAMIDPPAAMLYAGLCAAAVLALTRRDASTLPALVLICAFFVGVKISYVAFLPLGLVLAVAIACAARLSLRRTLAMLALLLVASSPFYVRSFVLSGDPLEPLLNLKFRHADPIWSEADLRGQQSDLRGDDRPLSLLTMPYTMFVNPASRETRTIGQSLLSVLYPLPMLALCLLLLRRRSVLSPFGVCTVLSVYCCAYWLTTSHEGRYELLFLPVLGAFVGLALATATRSSVAQRWTAACAAAALLIPSPNGWPIYNVYYTQAYLAFPVLYTTDQAWLEPRSPSYTQIEDLAHYLYRVHAQTRPLYIVDLGGSMLAVQEHGIKMMGDVFGPGRFDDLSDAILEDNVPAFLAQFHVSALVVESHALVQDPSVAGLGDELIAAHWRMYRYPQDTFLVFTPPDLPPLVEGERNDDRRAP